MLSVIKAQYVDVHKLYISFNNGKSGEVNLHDAIFNDKRPPFGALKDDHKFRRFKIEHDTVIWRNELDLAPEFLFFLAFKTSAEYQELFKEWGYIT